MAAHARPLTLLEKGVTPKKNSRRFYSSQYGAFPCFSFLFFPWPTRMPITFSKPIWHGADCLHMEPSSPPSTQYRHWDTQHPVWQGIWTGTGHPGGGMQRFWSRVTDRDKNPDRGVLMQPDFIRCYILCSSPIQRQGITGRHGVCCRETGPTGGGSSPHTSTGQTWWAAR